MKMRKIDYSEKRLKIFFLKSQLSPHNQKILPSFFFTIIQPRDDINKLNASPFSFRNCFGIAFIDKDAIGIGFGDLVPFSDLS